MHHLTVPRRHAQVPHRIRLAGAIVAGLLVAGAVRAQPSPPWSPDAGGRHDLALLADEADLALPLTQWPLPRAAVQRALAALPAQLSPALEAARARVQRQLAEAAGSQLSIGVRNNLDEALGGFADETGPGSWVALRSSTLESPHLALQVGGRIFADPRNGHGSTFRLDDTAVATEAFGVQLQAWTHRNWWGPGWNSSLVLGDNAPQLSGIGLQRAAAGTSPSRWLSWLGPWNAEFFIAQTENDVQSFLIGTRLTVKPWHWLELGFTRNLQWGGEGHPQSFSSLIDALLGRGNNVDPTQADTDNSSGIGGFDVRLRCPGGLRCAASLQVMGEDAGGRSPTQRLGLIGLEGWSADGTQRVMFEYANTTCGAVGLNEDPNKGCAYRNHAYPEGYTHAARWLGASVGPDSELLSLGWLDAASDTRVRVHGGRVGSRIGRFSARDQRPDLQRVADRRRPAPGVRVGRWPAGGRARLGARARARRHPHRHAGRPQLAHLARRPAAIGRRAQRRVAGVAERHGAAARVRVARPPARRVRAAPRPQPVVAGAAGHRQRLAGGRLRVGRGGVARAARQPRGRPLVQRVRRRPVVADRGAGRQAAVRPRPPGREPGAGLVRRIVATQPQLAAVQPQRARLGARDTLREALRHAVAVRRRGSDPGRPRDGPQALGVRHGRRRADRLPPRQLLLSCVRPWRAGHSAATALWVQVPFD
jgi:hypothetical protein